ncbi:MAG: DUF4168 domain-containing protein [Thiohalomonadaceae bacterium]
MTHFKPLALATFCALTFGLSSHLAAAQPAGDEYTTQESPSTMQDPSAPQEMEISDSQLALYAQAATKVEEIRQGIQEQMPQAESAEQAQAFQEEAMQQMVAAVESFGMTVEEYNQIATAVQQSAEMQSRLQELM